MIGLALRQNTAETEIEEKNRRVKVFNDLFATLIAHRDRNSQFYGLTRKERDDLGAVEYEALRLLWYLVPVYLAFFLLSGTLILDTYVASTRPQPAIADGASPWYIPLLYIWMFFAYLIPDGLVLFLPPQPSRTAGFP
jgi:hypothetical protein